MDIWRRVHVSRWESGGGANDSCRSCTQVVDNFDEGVLNGSLRLAYVQNVGLQAPNPPSTMKDARQGRTGNHTHSKPASPVKEASRLGFSKRQSRDCCLHRLQGGFSAPSHRIFCFLQAFCAVHEMSERWKVRVRVPRDSRKHLERGTIGVSEGDKGKDSLGRTWNSVQGSFDGFDVLSAGAASIFDGFELFDKLRTGWTSAVDEIHGS